MTSLPAAPVEPVTRNDDVVVLFSGGTDSTLTSAMLQEQFRTVHLLTYNRMGFHSTENTSVNADMLRERFGADRYEHAMISVEKLFQWISYERYFQNLRRYGLYLLSTCGLCKLAMHMRTVKYCVDHKIRYAADGANQAMTMEPAQMKPVIDELRGMYSHFGVKYFNPVFDFKGPQEKTFVDHTNAQFFHVPDQEISSLTHESKVSTCSSGGGELTPGERLYQIGLAPLPNVKGSDYDRKRQPRCFQFVLFNMFAVKHFTANRTYEEYETGTTAFFKDKIGRAIEVLAEHFESGKHAKLFE